MFGGFGLRIVTIGEGADTVPSALFTTNDTVFGPDETVAISSGSASIASVLTDPVTAVIIDGSSPPPTVVAFTERGPLAQREAIRTQQGHPL